MGEQARAAWGRVGEDGTVYVTTADGERPVGSWPDADPGEALAFFTRRYERLEVEVDLLSRRVRAGTLSPEDATAAIRKQRAAVADAPAVGDLGALLERLDGLDAEVARQREQRRAERERRAEEARQAKERLVAEAEQLAASSDWRSGPTRLADLLQEWKSLPRLERTVDDALWQRFSTARSTYARRRKQHLADLHERREAARAVKERLVAEAESLAGSTDWGPTANRFRELMREWKAAGSAHRAADEQLWSRFSAAQDRFFAARNARNAEQDQQYAANQLAKETLLREAEKLLPVKDERAARRAFREIATRWEAVGRVPRAVAKDLDARLRRIEQEVRAAEEDRWRRSNPEARARAADTVAKLEASITALERDRDTAAAAGDHPRAQELAAAVEVRRTWLAQARKALDDFTPRR